MKTNGILKWYVFVNLCSFDITSRICSALHLSLLFALFVEHALVLVEFLNRLFDELCYFTSSLEQAVLVYLVVAAYLRLILPAFIHGLRQVNLLHLGVALIEPNDLIDKLVGLFHFDKSFLRFPLFFLELFVNKSLVFNVPFNYFLRQLFFHLRPRLFECQLVIFELILLLLGFVHRLW